jgi:hypothetical protein
MTALHYAHPFLAFKLPRKKHGRVCNGLQPLKKTILVGNVRIVNHIYFSVLSACFLGFVFLYSISAFCHLSYQLHPFTMRSGIYTYIYRCCTRFLIHNTTSTNNALLTLARKWHPSHTIIIEIIICCNVFIGLYLTSE